MKAFQRDIEVRLLSEEDSLFEATFKDRASPLDVTVKVGFFLTIDDEATVIYMSCSFDGITVRNQDKGDEITAQKAITAYCKSHSAEISELVA